MLSSITNFCLQNRINYENKYLCAVCIVSGSGENTYMKVHNLTQFFEIIIQPYAKTNITTKRAALTICSHKPLQL